MLKVVVRGDEFYDEAAERFVSVGDVSLDLEHSLISLSKWESKHEKPFLSPGKKSTEEVLDYIKFMIITTNVPSDILSKFSSENILAVQAYIDSSQSATTFGAMPQTRGRGETITAELIYYWMVAFNIPFECETWHLNRLFALIRICNIKNSKSKKMSRTELAARNRELNAQRKAQLGTTG